MKKTLLTLGVLFISICLVGCSAEVEDLQNDIEDMNYAYPDSKDTTVTLAEYQQLSAGMTEQQVWDTIGGKCTNTGTTDLGMGAEYVTISYGCNGEGSVGANVILMFQGGKLTTMSQAGLK